MKTYFSTHKLRMIAAGILFAGAAGLAAAAIVHIRLPWAVPAIKVGVMPSTAEIDVVTNTIYIPNPLSNTISVVDGSQCQAGNSAHCKPIATMTNVGFGPLWPTLDGRTHTLYVANTLTSTGDFGNEIAVLDVATCNAHDISGCSLPPVASVAITGFTGDGVDSSDMALDPTLHTLYITAINETDTGFGPISMIDTATCNALQTAGCSHVMTGTATGLGLAIDPSNHSVYLSDLYAGDISLFNAATCNAQTQSDCSATSVAALPAGYLPYIPDVDPSTHSVYVPLFAEVFDVLGYTAVIDGSTCNAADHSGCGKTPQLVQAGGGALTARFDRTTKTVYVMNEGSNSLSVIDATTCNGLNPSGCPSTVPALATGLNPIAFAINPRTHSLYAPSRDTNRVWVLDASQCNGQHPEGCPKFAQTTPTGVGAQSFANNPATHTLYSSNQLENTVSVIDTALCNQGNLAGCNQTWPKFATGNAPRFLDVNRATNTIYLVSQADDTLAVIDGTNCNSSTTSGCGSYVTTAVGTSAQHVAVDESTNTVYVLNQGDNNVSIIDGSHCNGTDSSGCNQSWPVARVGGSPQALTLNPSNHTVYVTNTADNTVSVIDGNHCNGSDTSGCTPVATFPVAKGSRPRAVGVVTDSDTVFVGGRDSLAVTVIDGSTCNGTQTSGCPNVAPPEVLVGAFPGTGGTGNNLLGRSITVDQSTHQLFVPMPGDSDLVQLDGNTCRADNLEGCRPTIVRTRMGGFPITVAVDEPSATVYVANDADGTVSIVPEAR